VIKRLALALLAVVGVALLTFVVQFVVPGDPARNLAPRSPSPQVLALIRRALHLNDPLLTQLGHYFWALLHGDLGQSYVRREPVSTLLMDRLPATGELALAGVLVEMVVGSGLGILAALRPRLRFLTTSVSLGLLSVPSFTLGLLLLLLFGFTLGIAPVTGGSGLSELVLPALTLGLGGAPWYAGLVEEQMIESLSSSYVRTAVAKGLTDRQIVRRHVLRNVISPALTLVGLDLGIYFSGVVVVEAVFDWPGVGQLAVQSLNDLDRPVVMGTVLFGAAAVVLLNLAVDVARMYVDPRTRQEPA
jgi:peptide/nickel transport system permease protein